MKIHLTILYIIIISTITHACRPVINSDLNLINGKIVTVDSEFSIAEAVAIRGDSIIAVGTTRKIKRLAGHNTRTIDLKGRTVIPGLIDSHLHPESASVSEIEEVIPDVHSIKELLEWIGNQSNIKKEGEWIIFPKFFSTRLAEMRQPDLEELDLMSPRNPVF